MYMTYVSIHMYMCSREICSNANEDEEDEQLAFLRFSKCYCSCVLRACFVMYRSTRRGGCLAYNSHVQDF